MRKNSVFDSERSIAEELLQLPSGQMNALLDLAHTRGGQYDTTFCSSKERPRDWKLDQEDAISDIAEFMLPLKNQTETVKVANAVTQVLNQLSVVIPAAPLKVNGTAWFITSTIPISWAFGANASGIALYTDFHGYADTVKQVTVLGWQGYWYTRTTQLDSDFGNQLPYQFVASGPITWADVFNRYWVNKGKLGTVEPRFCTTALPSILYIRRQYLPLVLKE